MLITYADHFRVADKERRKRIIENMADYYDECDVLERRWLRKQYEEIKEILFQEGKLPM